MWSRLNPSLDRLRFQPEIGPIAMGFLSFFQRRKDPENFETVLEDLRISINSRRQRLAEMRVRERRATLWTTLYLMAVWIVYTTIWYAGWIHALVGVNRSHLGQILWTKTLITAPVFIGPVASVFVLFSCSLR